MQDADLFAFMAIFRSLLHVFPKRLDEAEIGDLSRAYFTAFRRFTVAQIQTGADVWMQRGKFFPKPAEWRECIPRDASSLSVALVELSPVDAAEYLDAERKHYEGDPCDCRRCVGAGVSHRFLRYVPETDESGMEARVLIGTRTVVRGHWAHGDELFRLYEARDRFWAEYRALIERMTMPRAGPVAEVEIAADSEVA